MPNWCENDLQIRAQCNSDLQEVLSFIANPEEKAILDFNKIIPYPQNFVKQDNWAKICRNLFYFAQEHGSTAGYTFVPKNGYNSGGYEWCILNWGTKWNACNTIMDDISANGKRVTLHFDTVWSPPIPIIEALLDRFPNVHFTLSYYEGGCCFAGIYSCIRDTTRDYIGPRGGNFSF